MSFTTQRFELKRVASARVLHPRAFRFRERFLSEVEEAVEEVFGATCGFLVGVGRSPFNCGAGGSFDFTHSLFAGLVKSAITSSYDIRLSGLDLAYL